ncbi:MAG: hypothetical protein ACREOO_29700 [bacterium]
MKSMDLILASELSTCQSEDRYFRPNVETHLYEMPTPRLMYILRLPTRLNSPQVYLLLLTGNSGGGRNGGLHCPP